MNSDIEIYKRHAADEHCDLGTDLTSPEAQTTNGRVSQLLTWDVKLPVFNL